MNEPKELTIRPVDNLLAAAVEKNIDVDKLERLIDMRNRELARQAKQDYDEHFAQMQLDYLPVGKSRAVFNKEGTRQLYKYCPLEDILRVYQPIISKHGFSYRWSEETINAQEKRIFCIVAGYGHEERSYVDIPIQAATTFTNSVQQRGSATTYGKRYSFIDAFGVIIDGEDDDGNSQVFDPATDVIKSSPGIITESPEWDELLDQAVADERLSKANAEIWRSRLENPSSKKAAEDWLRSNLKAPIKAALEPETVDKIVQALIDFGNAEGLPYQAKKEIDAAVARNERNPIELKKLLAKVKTAYEGNR